MPALRGFADWLQAKLPDIRAWFENVSAKFTDLLGVSESSSEGIQRSVLDWTAGLSRAGGDTERAAGEVERHLDEMARTSGQAMTLSGDSIGEWRKQAEDDFSDAGTFMERLGEAWRTVWDEDIKPWFMDTLIPWIVEDFAPALGRAFRSAGANAGRSFLEGFDPLGVKKGLDWFFGEGPGFTPPTQDERRAREQVGPSPVPGHPGSTTTVSRPGGNLAFHSGGIVPGPRGREVNIRALGGERILSPHESRRKDMNRVTINLPSGGRREGLASDEVVAALVEYERENGSVPVRVG